jgi:hypothetical protein
MCRSYGAHTTLNNKSHANDVTPRWGSFQPLLVFFTNKQLSTALVGVFTNKQMSTALVGVFTNKQLTIALVGVLRLTENFLLVMRIG